MVELVAQMPLGQRFISLVEEIEFLPLWQQRGEWLY
jgi:hypothetical protein